MKKYSEDESGKATVVHNRMPQQRNIKSDDDSLVNTSPFLRETKTIGMFLAEEGKLLTQCAKTVDSCLTPF